MVLELIRAALLGTAPVAFFTFLILQWSITSGRLSRFEDEKGLQRQYKARTRAAKESRKARKAGQDVAAQPADDQPLFHKRAVGDIFHSKVMFFGSGFYGTMAVLTYILIEILEIWTFLVGMLSPTTWIEKIGLDLLIEFFVNSLINLVAAFVWFVTLPEYINIDNGFIWLAAAYLGYLGGLRLTTTRGDEIWEKMLVCIVDLKGKLPPLPGPAFSARKKAYLAKRK